MTAQLESLAAIIPLRTKLQRRVMDQFDCGNFTADEIAIRLGLSILTARPRCAELVKRGFLEDSGQRRKNNSGRSATVWTLKKDDQQFLPLAAFNNNETPRRA
jgi:predicted ArsR family transcriptional regulator